MGPSFRQSWDHWFRHWWDLLPASSGTTPGGPPAPVRWPVHSPPSVSGSRSGDGLPGGACEGFHGVERLSGVDRKTVRRYVTAAVEAGLDRAVGEEQLTDEFLAVVVEKQPDIEIP